MIKDISKYLLKALIAILFISLIISFYQYIAHLLIDASNNLMSSNSLLTVILAITVGVLILIFAFWCNNKFENKYYNNGIDLLEKYYEDEYEIKPLESIIFIFVNSLIAFYGGFLLGAEAPSVSLGGSIGVAINKIFNDDDKEITKICASAGFACAFLTPISGVAHFLDEHKEALSLKTLLKAAPIIILSALLASFVYKHSFVSLNINNNLIWYGYFLLIPLTFVTYILARLFRLINREIKNIFTNKYFLMIFTGVLFITFLIIKRFNPILVSGGAMIFNMELEYAFYVLLALLSWRILGTIFSNNSYVGGGLVVPALAIGALIGLSYISIISLFFNEYIAYKNIFIACGMFLFFAFVSGNYLTSISLIGELLLSKALLPYALCIAIASILVFIEYLFLKKKTKKNLAMSEVI